MMGIIDKVVDEAEDKANRVVKAASEAADTVSDAATNTVKHPGEVAGCMAGVTVDGAEQVVNAQTANDKLMYGALNDPIGAAGAVIEDPKKYPGYATTANLVNTSLDTSAAMAGCFVGEGKSPEVNADASLPRANANFARSHQGFSLN